MVTSFICLKMVEFHVFENGRIFFEKKNNLSILDGRVSFLYINYKKLKKNINIYIY